MSKDQAGVFVITTDAFAWTDAAGNPQSYTVTYSPETLQTDFGCDVPGDIGLGLAYLPTSIAAPDGTYSINYESQISGTVTGRISSITFPSGASIAYTYTGGNNGLTCQQQTSESTTLYNVMVPVLKRTLTDTTGTAHSWRYDTTQATNETVVTDPSRNDTVYSFYTPTIRLGAVDFARSRPAKVSMDSFYPTFCLQVAGSCWFHLAVGVSEASYIQQKNQELLWRRPVCLCET